MAAKFDKALEAAEPSDGWGTPDLSILQEGRRKPPAMPCGMFGKAWLELEKLAADKGAPVDYVALGWLTACSSLIGSKRRAVPYRGFTWSEPSILWIGLVGDPSSNKSPAIDPFQSILREIEQKQAEDHQEKLKVWKADFERAKAEHNSWADAVKAAVRDKQPAPPLPAGAVEPDKPARRRFIIQDGTPEAVGSILVGNPEGRQRARSPGSNRHNLHVVAAFQVEAANGP